jgi:hypothetical protein
MPTFLDRSSFGGWVTGHCGERTEIGTIHNVRDALDHYRPVKQLVCIPMVAAADDRIGTVQDATQHICASVTAVPTAAALHGWSLTAKIRCLLAKLERRNE